ncbi:MAG: DNA replication and repair protein RecF [Gammaproteobacteria bacterium]|nr:DNA replication and repair protein RecF [Gammaproteobacteria bacterium]
MAQLTELKVRNLRALEDIDLSPDGRVNLITGHNGAGKTTVLEAIYLLSRGRSFRGSDLRQLVAHGKPAAAIGGTVVVGKAGRRLGLTISGRSARARLDGADGARRPEIARLLPVLNMDARLMDLVDRGPERRRLLLNWVTFHVEPGFNAAWRRFRRTLRQRNASLRQGAAAKAVAAWDGEFCRAALEMEALRKAVAGRLRPRFAKTAARLTGMRADWDYHPGWPREDSLEEILRAGLDGDRRQGNTRFGPQRADLVLRLESRRARYIASRGQQKLLASSLMLAASEVLDAEGANRPVLLVDEPLAELDADHGQELLRAFVERDAQIFIAAVDTAPFRQLMEAPEIRLKEGALV